VNAFYEWQKAPAADFAVIGDPVAHSLSPRMHAAAYRALDLPYTYVAVQASSEELHAALNRLAALGFIGANITVPHKERALAWSPKPDQIASRIGAANTLDFRDGSSTNTDAPGFLHTLKSLDVTGGRALLLGAGGSARAIAAVLPSAGFQVSIWNRTPGRALALADEFGLTFLERANADFDLIVNTTSAGLSGDELPLDWSGCRGSALAYDLVYGETHFLRTAREHGLKTVDGIPLLAAQGALSLGWWLGIEPPFESMLEAVD
jgi:shikimate dehydrogenase